MPVPLVSGLFFLSFFFFFSFFATLLLAIGPSDESEVVSGCNHGVLAGCGVTIAACGKGISGSGETCDTGVSMERRNTRGSVSLVVVGRGEGRSSK
jgi:hypothetical protein